MVVRVLDPVDVAKKYRDWRDKEILRLHRPPNGHSQAAIARMFGISRQRVHQIIHASRRDQDGSPESHQLTKG